jgi:hypothetical protein
MLSPVTGVRKWRGGPSAAPATSFTAFVCDAGAVADALLSAGSRAAVQARRTVFTRLSRGRHGATPPGLDRSQIGLESRRFLETFGAGPWTGSPTDRLSQCFPCPSFGRL